MFKNLWIIWFEMSPINLDCIQCWVQHSSVFAMTVYVTSVRRSCNNESRHCDQVAIKIIDKTQLNPTSLQKVTFDYLHLFFFPRVVVRASAHVNFKWSQAKHWSLFILGVVCNSWGVFLHRIFINSFGMDGFNDIKNTLSCILTYSFYHLQTLN